MASAEAKVKATPVVVTVDGPAGAGKSTIAKELALRLDYTYLDTGAMYRALTLKALDQGIDLTDEQAVIDLANKATIDLDVGDQHALRVLLDNKDVTKDIRSMKVTNNTFRIAVIPDVREVMVRRQREIGQRTNVVVEGRDVGTVVFPNATKKFYLDANPDERVGRRIKELKEKGQDIDEDRLRKKLMERDQMDLTREVGPLKKAEDAILIDSTNLSINEVVEKMLGFIVK